MPTLLDADQRPEVQTAHVPLSPRFRRRPMRLPARMPSTSRSGSTAPSTSELDPRTTLLDALREHLAHRHQEGLRPRAVRRLHRAGRRPPDQRLPDACGHAAGQGHHHDRRLGADGALHPLQAAFIEHDGFQCGYCTPGQIMSAVGLLAEGRTRSDDEIREFMSGNICRCGAYTKIVAAIRSVAAGGA